MLPRLTTLVQTAELVMEGENQLPKAVLSFTHEPSPPRPLLHTHSVKKTIIQKQTTDWRVALCPSVFSVGQATEPMAKDQDAM